MDILTDDLVAAGIRISPSGRVRYPEDYLAYAERYSKSPRAIRDWVAHGKKEKALPPLHDPAGMVTWWKERKKTRVPQIFLDLSIEAPTEGREESRVTEKNSEEDEEEVRDAPKDVELEGAEESLRQARTLVNEAYRKLRKSKDPGERESLRKDWTQAVETQRKWEKDFNQIQEARGLLVRKPAVQVEVAAVANVLQRAFLSSMESLLKKYAPQVPASERRAASVAQRDSCFEVLRSGYFGEDLFQEV